MRMKANVCLTLNPPALKLLDAEAERRKEPRSHVVEMLVMDRLADVDVSAQVKTLANKIAAPALASTRIGGKPRE